MKTYFAAAIMLLVLIGSFSCTKEKRLMYEQDARVYFSKYIVNPDSTDYSFGVRSETITTDTVYLTMRIMGDAVDYDRVINLKLVEGSTAVWGYHFKIEHLIMPADSFQYRVPVVLMKRPGMKDSIMVAEFEVIDSKDFKPGYNDKPSSIYVRDRLHYKLSITDQVIKPANWETSLRNDFGEYSVVKFKFMIEVTGRIIWTGAIFPGDKNFYIQSLRLALYEYEQLHGPMLDETGKTVEFP